MDREMIAGDLEFDPTYRVQREAARYMLGILINAALGRRQMFQADQPIEDAATAIRETALKLGIVSFDEWHHAPACRANNWSRQVLPTGPCTCGAERWELR